MKKAMKWINAVASIVFVLAVTAYLLLRPVIVQNLEPVLHETAAERVNGTVTWSAVDLDPSFDLAFSDFALKDADGKEVFAAPSLTVRWTFADAFDAWKNGKGVAAMVKDVVLENPSLHVREKENHTWNVQNLLKPQKEKTPDEFKGRVLVQSGNADVSLLSGQSYKADGLSGQASWLNAGQIDAALDGTFTDAKFHLAAVYKDENNFEGTMEMDPVALKILEPLLKALPEGAQHITIQEGTGQVTKAKVWRSGGNLSYHIAGRLQDAALGIYEYTLTDGAAFFDIYDGMVQLSDVTVRINGERLTGSASFSWKGEPAGEVSAELHQVHLEKFVPAAAGIITGTVHAAGPLSAPFVSGSLFVSGGSYQNISVSQGSGDFSWRDGVLSLSRIDAYMAGGRLSGSGMYSAGTGEFSVSGNGENLNLSPLADSFGVSGRVSGDFRLSGIWQEGAPLIKEAAFSGEGRDLSYGGAGAGLLSGSVSYDGRRYSALFYGEGLSYEGVLIDSAAGEAEGDGETWTIPYLNGTMGSGAFAARGTYGKDGTALSVSGSAIDAAPLARAFLHEEAEGKLSFHGKVTGQGDAPHFEGTLSLEDGSFRGASIRSLTADVSAGTDAVTVRRLTADTDTGRHSLSGRIGLTGSRQLSLREESDHARMENLLPLAGLSYPVTGWVKNSVTIGGTLDNPSLSGHAMAWEGSLAGELFQSISLDYALRDGTVTIANGLAYIYSGALSFSGTVSKDSLALDVALVDVDLDRILRDKPVKGRVTVQGRVTGSLSEPFFTGYGESRAVTVNGAALSQVSASLFYQGKTLQVTDGRFRQREGQFRWSGLVNTDTGALDGRLQFTKWDLGEACRAFQAPLSDVSGSMDGGMVVKGTLSDPDVSLQVKLNSGGMLGRAVMGEGEADLSYMNGNLFLRKLSIPVGDGLLAAKGTIGNDGTLSLETAATHMDISWIPEVMGRKDLALAGTMTAAVNLSGTRDDPKADISLTVDHPSYSGIALDSLSLMGYAEKGVFHIDQLLGTRDQYRAAAAGTMPVAAITGMPGSRDIPFNLDINLDKADLNALVFFAKPVTAASGPIEGHLKVKGAWDDPEVEGSVTVREGALTLESMGEPVSHILAQMDFTGKEAALIVNAEAGGGTISAAGHLFWDHMAVSRYDAEAVVHMKNFDSLYYKGQMDAHLYAGSEKGLPKIYGTVDIANAVLDIPLSLESGGAGPDILMDVSVNIGDKVRLYNSMLYDMYVRGNIHAMGLMSRPVMSGRVNVEKGTVRYLSNVFTVNSGTAVWGGVPDSFLPVLNVAADAVVGHYKVGMELQGPPGHFQFDLRSEPALTDSQIVTLLTLRQAPGMDNDAATGVLFNAGLQMVFSGGVEDTLRNTFGLDLVSVTSSLNDYYDNTSAAMNDDFYYIKIGKYLFNDFMLTATMGLNNDQQSVGFRYDLKSRIGLAAWYNNDHDSYIGADYQFRF